MRIPSTCSQTVGPYFSIGLEYRNSAQLCSPNARGEHVHVCGQIFDGEGFPVPDGQLELWQADADGRFAGLNPEAGGPASEDFSGFARVPFDPRGGFTFHTIRPGPVPGADGREQAPHIVVLVFMRGVLRHLHTRMYFAGDPRNERDAVLSAVPLERRDTLLAQLDGDAGQYLWNIRLQGEYETVFFEY